MKKIALFILLCAAPLFAQNVRFEQPFPSVTTLGPVPYLVANTGANAPLLTVCHSPANAVPCTNYATTYTGAGIACPNGAQDTPSPNSLTSACQPTGDAQGNIGFWAPAGTYDYTVCVGINCFGPYTLTLGSSGGGSGTITGVTAQGPITGGGLSGGVNVGLALCPNNQVYQVIAGVWTCAIVGGNVPLGTAAQIPVVNIAGTAYVPQSKTTFDVRDYGVVGSPSGGPYIDDTASFQNAVNAACGVANTGKSKKLIIPNMIISVSATVTFKGCQGLTVDGQGNNGSTPFYSSIQWIGANNSTVPVIEINQVRDSTFKNFNCSTQTGNNANSTSICIDVDELSPVTAITTNVHFENIYVNDNAPAQANFVAWRIAQTGPGNLENLTFERMGVGCSGGLPASISANGTAFLIVAGSGAQPNYTYFHASEINDCSIGWDVQGNNKLTIIDGGLTNDNYVVLDYEAGILAEIKNIRDESSTFFAKMQSNAGDLTADHLSLSGLNSGTTSFDMSGASSGARLWVSNSTWDNVAMTPISSNAGGGALTALQGNIYPNSNCPLQTQTFHGRTYEKGSATYNAQCLDTIGTALLLTSPNGAGGGISFGTGMGNINQITGPSDQPFQIATQNNKNLVLAPNGTGSTIVSSNMPVLGPRPWIDVTHPTYGADPTGVVDATTPINNAIAACAGGTVFFPQGTYLIKGTLTFNNAGCTYLGQKRAALLQRWSGVTTTAIMVNVTAGSKINGLAFDGNQSLLTGTPCGAGNPNHGCGTLIAIHDLADVRLEDNLIENCGGNNGCVYVYSNGTPTSRVWVSRNDILPSSLGTGGNGSFADGIFVSNAGASGGGLNHVFVDHNYMDCSGNFGYAIALDCIGVHATNPNQDFGEMTVDQNDMICPSNANAGFCIEVGQFIACGTVACTGTGSRPHNITVSNNKATASASGVGFYSITFCTQCTVSGNSTNSNGFQGQNSGIELTFSDHTSATGNTIGNCENTSTNGVPYGFLMVATNFTTVSGNTVCGVSAVNGHAAFNPTTGADPSAAISTITGAGPTYTITTGAAYSTFGHFAQGGYLYVNGVTPSGFNGVWRVLSNPTSTTLTISIPTTGLTYVSGGNIGASVSGNIIANNIFTYPDTAFVSTINGVLLSNSANFGGMLNNQVVGNTVIGGNGTGQTAFSFSSSGTSTVTDNNMLVSNIMRNVTYGFFLGASNITNTFIKGNNIFGFTGAQIQSAGAGTIQFSDEPIGFAAYAACNSALEGNMGVVTDDATVPTVTGGGSQHVQMYCDGTAWTVSAKSLGTAATLTGTGACATFSTQSGGSQSGQATCTGTTGASTLTISPGYNANHGWTCSVQDQTTRANLLQQTNNTISTCVFTATSVTSNDVFVFTATPF